MDRLAWGRQDHFRGRPSQRRKLGYTGFVAKQTITTIFIVEPANDGWSVGVGDERLSLFVTKRQALDDVKKRRARLTATGQRSTVLVHGSVSTSGRSTR